MSKIKTSTGVIELIPGVAIYLTGDVEVFGGLSLEAPVHSNGWRIFVHALECTEEKCECFLEALQQKETKHG